MRVLFPSLPFDEGVVDSAFDAEWSAAGNVGLATHLIDTEALDAGAHDRAVRRLPEPEGDALLVYRGWMLTADSYRALAAAVARRGFSLVNDAAQYRHAHHLPESYSIIRDHTPATVWTTTGAAIDLPAVMTLLSPLGDVRLILKDYVKSQKHGCAGRVLYPIRA